MTSSLIMNRNNLTLPLLRGALSGALALAPAAASAANDNYAHGDLVLFFQQEGGTNTVYANLGNTATVFRGAASGPGATNLVNFKNINASLVAAFGANWASDPTIYAGLAGSWSNSNTGNQLQNADPKRTLYVSASRAAVGTIGQANSSQWILNTDSGATTGASNILQMNLVFENDYTNAVEVVPVGTSNIDDQNPFLAPGIQDNAFGVFGGGVQQAGSASSFGSFGDAGTVEFALDLYRILAKTGISGQVEGPLRQGTYEGTITVSSGGFVSFISQGSAPSSAFTTWIDSFNPPLTNESDRELTADPDHDGVANLVEFVLNGNPTASDASILPDLDASGSNFVFTFSRRDDAKSPETTQVFQYGPDMVSWTDITLGDTSAGMVTVTPNGTDPDTITITVPKDTNTKMFGRLKVTK